MPRKITFLIAFLGGSGMFIDMIVIVGVFVAFFLIVRPRPGV